MPDTCTRRRARRVVRQGPAAALLTCLLLLLGLCAAGTGNAASPRAAAAAPSAAAPASGAAAPAPPRVQTLQQRVFFQPGTRIDLTYRARVWVPPRPVTAFVVLLHQYGSSPQRVEGDSQLVPMAARYGWLLVSPAGQFSSWDSGLCCGRAADAGFPDTVFLSTTVRRLRAEFGLDARVPTVMGGLSNGAMETAQFMCSYPGRLDGAFLDAGNLQDPSCGSIARARTMLLTRGVNDTTVPINGTPYSTFLRTRLLPDTVLLDAFRRGSQCRVLEAWQRQGVSSRTESCGDRTMRIIYDQSGHGRARAGEPGYVDRVALEVAFINDVVTQTQRAVR